MDLPAIAGAEVIAAAKAFPRRPQWVGGASTPACCCSWAGPSRSARRICWRRGSEIPDPRASSRRRSRTWRCPAAAGGPSG
eukprot:854417-Pyramimonas_sp.AAC.1